MQERTAPPRSSLSWLSLLVLSSAIVALPVARGGVDPAAELAALVLVGGAGLLACWSSRSVPWSALPLLGVFATVLVQLIPLPAWLHALSPSTRETFQLSLGPLGRYPALRPLTLDIPATARELGKAAVCWVGFIAASTFAETHRRRQLLLSTLAACAPLIAAAFLGAALLLGSELHAPPTFPFVNPNHAAGLLVLTAPAALGIAFQAGGNARAMWALGFAAAAVVVFATTSRAGVGAFILASTLFLLRYAARRDGPSRRARPWLALAVAATIGIAFLLLGSALYEKVQALRSGDDLKISLWPTAARVLLEHPVIGIGRGAFNTVFPAYRSDTVPVTYTHLENEWLQIPIELGLPVGLLFLGTLVVVWARRGLRGDLNTPDLGLWAGLAGLGFQQLFDFSTEILGVALPATVALGLLTRGQRRVRLPRPLVPMLNATACALGLCGLVLATRVGDRASAQVAAAPSSTIAAVASTAAAWRPADYLPHAAAGRRLAAEGRCGEALPWLERAMLLAPTLPAPHLDTGRCLALVAPARARQEYRLTMLFGDAGALAEAELRWPELQSLLEVAPDTPDGLLRLGDLLLARRPADALRVYRRAWDHYQEPRALVPMARAALSAEHPDQALEAARLVLDSGRDVEEAHGLAATALITMGREDEAQAELEHGLAASPGSPVLIPLLAQRKLIARQFTEARRLGEAMIPRSAAEASAREMIQAQALAAQDRIGEAIDHARQATYALPDAPAPWILYRDLCLRAERLPEAISALEHLSALNGAPSDQYAEQLSDLRRRVGSPPAEPFVPALPAEDD